MNGSSTPLIRGSAARIDKWSAAVPCIRSPDQIPARYCIYQGFVQDRPIPPAELLDEQSYLLSTGRILFHYNVTTPYSAGIQHME